MTDHDKPEADDEQRGVELGDLDARGAALGGDGYFDSLQSAIDSEMDSVSDVGVKLQIKMQM